MSEDFVAGRNLEYMTGREGFDHGVSVTARWQPIETAPRDGSIVWVACASSMCPAYFAGDKEKRWRNWFKGCRYQYVSLGTDCFLPEGVWFEPTHWMPLPTPPAE